MIQVPECGPFVLLAREGRTDVEVLTGDVHRVDTLADIPLESGAEVFALVPFRQVRERGFEAMAEDCALLVMAVSDHRTVPREDAIRSLPDGRIPLENAGFDISDDDYAETVRRVIADEIGRGEGANFVIRRDFTADVDADPRHAALTWFRALLEHERGAYWTFAVVTEEVIAVGASPEAHVTARDGVVTMNPISGTFRHPSSGVTKDALASFLRDTKETEELFMVVDEELKMMSQVCSDGGRITGPHLKVMSRLTHTEYMLRGSSALDPRDILRETMFAPTVTGSPMQNACTVIRRHERSPRGYYSGVAALFTPNARGGHDLDAPILIRTAYLDRGRLRVPVGATLVRHSDPLGEVNETHGKAAGVLGAIGAIDAPDLDAPATSAPVEDDPEIAALLASRNDRLAPFWMREQRADACGEFAGTSVLVIDAEDRFTTMLAHQLRHLGFDASIALWSDVTDDDMKTAPFVVFGPGPGDPLTGRSPRIERMRELVSARRATDAPFLAVCLSHQVLAQNLGLDVVPLDHPNQGVQIDVDVFGERAVIGFYNTFTARGTTAHAEVAADPNTGDVYALRGRGFASVQGHLESILSRDGIHTLARLIRHALGPSSSPS